MAILDDEALAEAIGRMRLAGTDLALYELKDASGGFPKNTVDTISAFSNTEGGTIIFGISEKGKGFHAVEGLDPKTIQSHCAQAARELVEPPAVPDIRVLQHESKPVVVVNVPEMSARQKPCYVKRLGQFGGSFIRTGDGDHKMTLYAIDRFIENQHGNARHDSEIVNEATLADFDNDLLRGWLAQARNSSFDRMGGIDDETLLANRRVIKYDERGTARPTLAGLLALGSYPQKYFPRLNVVFSCYPSSQKGDPASGESRFIDSANIEGPIPAMVVSTLRAVSRNMKHGAIVRGALREDVPDYPLPAVREAVANALMHRDYSVESQGMPVMVDLYPDRLEIINPGGLYGSLTVENLGTRGSTVSRNQYLSRILEDVPYTDYDGSVGRVVENRGTGYPIILGALERALMPAPVITSTLDEFRMVLRHRRMTEQEGPSYTRKNVAEAILDYLAKHESVTTAEVANSAGMSNKTALGYINALISEGLVEGIGSKYSPKRRYRLVR